VWSTQVHLFGIIKQYIFIVIDERGCHRKGITIYNSTESKLPTKTYVLMNKNIEHDRKVKAVNNL
jgi:hypothetical protein